MREHGGFLFLTDLDFAIWWESNFMQVFTNYEKIVPFAQFSCRGIFLVEKRCGKGEFSTVCGKLCGKHGKSRDFCEFSTRKTSSFCGKPFCFLLKTFAAGVTVEKKYKIYKTS